MSRLNDSESGFSTLVTALIIIIVGLVVFLAWYVYQVKNKKDSTYNASAQTIATPNKVTAKKTASAPDPYAGWQTLQSNDKSMSIEIPGAWVNTVCSPPATATLFVSSSKDGAAKCNSGDVGEAIISRNVDDPSGKTAPTNNGYEDSFMVSAVTVNGVSGYKQSYTTTSNDPNLAASEVGSGTKIISYSFFKSKSTFSATYYQKVGKPDNSAVFNQIVQSWKF